MPTELTKQKRYSNSYLSKFQQCPLAAHYRYDLHLHPAETDAHHLVYGRALHKAFVVLYKENDLKLAQATLREHYPVQLDETDLAKTAPNGCFMLEKYVEHYDWDRNWKILANEQMDATEDRYTVKLDLVIEDTRTGGIYGVDHKPTGSYLDYKFFSKFDPDSQATQYFRYIKEKYGHCEGFIVNAIGLKYRQRKYKDEPAGFWCAFERVVLNRTDQQVAQEQESKNYWIDRIEHAKKTGVWGMNTNQCFLCEYQPACSAGWDWEHDSELILNGFKQVCEKWIPAEEAHCTLGLDHEEDHSGAIQAATAVEFNVEV